MSHEHKSHLEETPFAQIWDNLCTKISTVIVEIEINNNTYNNK